MKNIKAIIFDLGAVILNIDYHKTMDAFAKLGVADVANFYSKKQQTTLFDAIETGKISSHSFLVKLQESTTNASIAAVQDAWNALLLDLPEERLELIKALKQEYPIFLLSNTNAIHIDAIKQQIGTEQWNEFSVLFDKMYLSHEVGLRKPDKAIFHLILEEHNLNPENTLFIDDSPQHIKAAQEIGIQSHHLLDGEDILMLFPDTIL